MSSSSSEPSLPCKARAYFKNRGMELGPAPPPFDFLYRHQGNHEWTGGVILATEPFSLSQDDAKSIRAVAAESGISRISILAEGAFPPELTSLALEYCFSLVDLAELEVLPHPTSQSSGDSAPGQPSGSSGPPTQAASRATPPPLPILTPVHPVARIPKRSNIGQIAMILVGLYVGWTSVSLILKESGSQTNDVLESLISRIDKAPYVLPIDESSPTYRNSREEDSVAYYREMYRLDEIQEPGLIAIADDFQAWDHNQIPKFYLDSHRSTLTEHRGQLFRYKGLVLLLASQYPIKEQRIRVYNGLIPTLEELGDTRLTFSAKFARAYETEHPDDVQAALEGLEDMLQAAEIGAPFRIEEHLADFVRGGGTFLLENEPEALLQIIESSRAIPPWFKHLMRGEHHYNVGWNARGTGYANTVSENRWEVFRHQIALAEEAYTKSWELHPHPYTGSQLIGVARCMGGHPETLRWFEKTVAIRADYNPAYRSYLYSLMPRWGGSSRETLNFGRACLHPAVAGTSIPRFLLEAHNNLAKESGDKLNYWRTLPEREKEEVLAVLDAKISANSHPSSQRFFQSQKTGILFAFGRYHETAALFGQLGNDLDKKTFEIFGVSETELITTLALHRIPVSFAKKSEP